MKCLSRNKRSLHIEILERRELCAIDVQISSYSTEFSSITPKKVIDGIGYYTRFAMDFSEAITSSSFNFEDLQFTSSQDGNLFLKTDGNILGKAVVPITQSALPHPGFSNNTYLIETRAGSEYYQSKRGVYTFGVVGTVNDANGIPTQINETISWTINRQPYITMDTANVSTFTEEQAEVLVSPGATVFDPESPHFNGGKFTASITQNGTLDDQLFINDQGTGPGQVSVTGANVAVGGVVIGTFTGGLNGHPLVVTFNVKAQASNTQTLIRNIMFQNTSDHPSTLPRTVTYNIGDGGLKNPNVALANYTKTVNVAAINSEPLITATGSLGYQLNQPAIKIAPIAQVIDADSSTYKGGKFKESFAAGASAEDRLTLGGSFSITGTNVFYKTTLIGTVAANAGQGNTPLEITFNRNAFRIIVDRLVREIRLSTVNGTSTANRRIQLLLTEADGVQSNTGEVLVNVSN